MVGRGCLNFFSAIAVQGRGVRDKYQALGSLPMVGGVVKDPDIICKRIRDMEYLRLRDETWTGSSLLWL